MSAYFEALVRALKRRSYRRLLLSLPEVAAVRLLARLQRRDRRGFWGWCGNVINHLAGGPPRMYLRWREGAFRKYFQYFASALDNPRCENQSGRGVTLMIGTLGPGGAERQAVITLLGLRERGMRPLTMAAMHLRTDAQRFFLHRLEDAGIAVAEIDRDQSHDGRDNLLRVKHAVNALPRRMSEVMSFARTLAKHNPEIAHLWLDEVNIQGGLAAVAVGVPRIILHVRSLPPYHFLFYKPYMLEGYRWLAAQPAVTLAANSTAGARAYEEWLNLPTGRIRVIHNGFDFDADLSPTHRIRGREYRDPHGIPPDVLLVGTVIRFGYEKRPDLWVDIAERVGRDLPDVHFLMVGDGYLRSRIARRARRGPLAGRLHVVGYEKQALAAIAAMDLFLLTSRAEGLPNVLIEAQALGVPVATTVAGGAAETLVHGRTGWILKDERVEAAASDIVRLLTDNTWLERAGDEGREFVRANFNIERMLDETLAVYDPARGAVQQVTHATQ